MSLFVDLCVSVSVMIVAVVVLATVAGWAGRVSVVERAACTSMAAGLVWACPSWFETPRTPGFGDVLFLGGVAVLVAARYGATIADRLDGRQDGVVRWFR